MNQQESKKFLSDFNRDIHSHTLTFLNSSLEHEYQNNRAERLFCPKGLRISFMVLLGLIISRTVENLIFGAFGNVLYRQLNLALWTALFLMLGTVVVELAIGRFDKLRPFKGGLSLLCFFIAISYLSYSLNTHRPITIATYFCFDSSAMPYYICIFTIGTFYAYSWVMMAFGCTSGVIAYISFNHLHDAPICKLE